MRFYQISIQSIFHCVVSFCLFFSLFACAREGGFETAPQHCGAGNAPSRLNGLFWLLGEPTSAHVLCTVQDSQFKQVYVLEPDSRDPLLFQDELTHNVLVVERFSGSSARPSRATWFSADGVQLTQIGDWPQNTYSALRLSEVEGVATGFDLGQLRRFFMSASAGSLLGKVTENQKSFANFNPIVTLQSGAWLALISSGFDLTTFSANEAQVMRVSEVGIHPDGMVSVADASARCKNAFQTLQLSNARVILSCNPQYFGPVPGEFVAVFEVELLASGELKIRKIHAENGADVQRIDLFGELGANEVFFGMKQTTSDDYAGRVVRSVRVRLDSLQLVDFDDARGPLALTKAGERVVFCEGTTQLCARGELFVSQTDSAPSVSVNPKFSLPFLSFPAKIPKP